ncbi:hypothetical protein AB0M46_31950 [Dactylosporangium sp. NPDC051485]|uniref:hypothetical protein n=1 Tax=Dactylosporangium sp. NPDC051485 TaxID=3154846 RepID=UPI0034190A6C
MAEAMFALYAVLHESIYAQGSLPTAAAIRGTRVRVTSEHEHDGLRVSSGAVLDRLIALAKGNA